MSLSPNSIKAILFDLDGTLRHHLPESGEVFANYAASIGLPIDTEVRNRALRWEHYYFANSPELQADNETYSERSTFWQNFSRRRLLALGCTPEQAESLAPASAAHMRETHKPQIWVPEEVPGMLAMLNEAGYILGIVSNRNEKFEDQIQDIGVRQYFHFLLAAGEVNSFKPDAGIFRAALERAGTLANETLYVGDNYYADVVGAQGAGIRPVLYDPRGLFSDVECAVIRSFDELSDLLK